MKLIFKLQLLFFFSTMLIFSLFSYVAYNYDEIRLLDQTKQNLTALANIQKNRLVQFLDNERENLKIFTSNTQLQISLEAYLATHDSKHLEMLNQILKDAKHSLKENISLSVTDLDGNIIASTDLKFIKTHIANFPKSKELLQEIALDNYLGVQNNMHFESRAPLYFKNQLIGTFINHSTMNNLTSITQDYTGLGESGETVIAKATPHGAVYLSPVRFAGNVSYEKNISATKQNSPIIKALNNEIGFFKNTIDYRDVNVYSATQYINSTYWGVVVKVDKSEIDGKLNAYRNELFKMLIFIFPLILFVSYLIARSFVKPILLLTGVVKSFGAGHDEQKANESSNDELGILANTFNAMTKEISKTQKRLEEAEELVLMGSWELDIVSNILYWSENVFNIFEIPKAERDSTQTHQIFLKYIHPDDKERVTSLYENSIKNNEKYHIEHRIITPSGKIKFVEEIAIHTTDSTGKINKSYGAIIDITEKKKKTFTIQEQIRLIDEYIIMSSTDMHGQITYVSKAFCKISGYSQDELMGQNHRIVRHPDMSKALYKDLWSTLKKKETWSGEIKNRKKDGAYYWVYATISPVYDLNDNIIGYTAIRDDISDNKNIQEAQRIAKMGSWELDIGSDTIACSKEMCHLFDLPISASYSKDYLAQFIKSKYQEKVLAKIAQSAKNNQKFDVEFEIETLDGIEKAIYALGEVETDNDNKALKIIGILLDITDRKQIEKQLHAAKIQAEQAAIAKGNFVANMSHEIRTPMNAILGFTDLALKSNNLEDKVYEYLRKSKSASIGLLDIINDILDFSKIESKKLVIEELAFNLKTLMLEIMEMMEYSANKKKIELKLEFIAMSDCYIGDPIRIKQVLINIIGNAIKFTQKGYVKIEILKNLGVVQFRITDTGIGMSEQQLQIIFEPFVQADTSTARKFGGTGLGTVISKELVALMSGEIRVESKINGGSTFIIDIPLEEAQCPDCFPPLEDDTFKAIHDGRLLNILLVEDNPLNAELIQINLGENRGHKITWVENGQEALDAIIHHHAAYDLILMDVQMPVMDGIQATQAIRKFEENSDLHIPIIALTASVTAEEQAITKAAGMDGFSLKPLIIEDLLLEIQRVIPKGASVKNLNTTMPLAIHSKNKKLNLLNPMINVELGLKTWTNEHAYIEALKKFAMHHQNDITLIAKAISTQNYQEVLRLLHILKGLSLGFVDLQKESQLLHDKVLHEESDINITKLTEAFSKTLKLIDTLDWEQNTITKELIQAKDLKENVQKLIDMLDRGESDDGFVLVLLNSLKREVDENQYSKLYFHLENFDYESASEILIAIQKYLK